MKSRNVTEGIAIAILVLACGLVAFFLLDFSGRSGARSHWTWRVAHFLHLKLPPLSPENEASAKMDAIAWKTKFLTEFPALQITATPELPSEENGFKALIQYSDRKWSISDEFSNVLKNINSCDLDVAKRCLAEHAEMVAQVEQIASLKKRSSMNIKGLGCVIFPISPTKQCSDILLLKARMAAVEHQEEKAIQFVQLAENLADHLREIETPTLITETGVVLLDLEHEKFTLMTLLPTLGASADLEKWRSLLGKRQFSPATLAHALRGEWIVSSDHLAFPLMASSYRIGEIPDAEATLRVYSAWMHKAVSQLSTGSLADMESILAAPVNDAGISRQGSQMLGSLLGCSSWSIGYARSAVKNAMHQAALDLLILEKSGSTLAASDTAHITQDPFSCKPFTFDPAKRCLSTTHPAIDPLTLPW